MLDFTDVKCSKSFLTVVALMSGGAGAMNAMPPSQQNALVEKYCAVCHSDAHPNGGISFERFDAAKPDPGVAAMIVSKLYGGAFGASGQKLPDKATQDDLLNSLVSESQGSEKWNISRGPMLTASIVTAMPSTLKEAHGHPDLYRLVVSCQPDRRGGKVQLAWSPATPKDGSLIQASVDGKALSTYKVEGQETMGNGQAGTSGPGAILLYGGDKGPKSLRLPEHSLNVNNLFGEGTVQFPFDQLDQDTRRQLSACF